MANVQNRTVFVNLIKNEFEVESIVTDLKKVREYSLEEQNPVVTKALRLAYEHLENNNAFFIGIPDDEPLDEETETTTIISKENDLVYDCFLGIGTTAKMAKVNNRNFIGSEISKEYCEIAKERLNFLI